MGDPGTSKTAVTSHFLSGLSRDAFVVLKINFSSRTSSMDVQKTIETAVEKRTKDIFGPPVGKKLVTFIDDMNLPQVDTYGTQQPIALLKLLVDREGMFDRTKDLSWKKFKDMCKFGEALAYGTYVSNAPGAFQPSSLLWDAPAVAVTRWIRGLSPCFPSST